MKNQDSLGEGAQKMKTDIFGCFDGIFFFLSEDLSWGSRFVSKKAMLKKQKQANQKQ